MLRPALEKLRQVRDEVRATPERVKATMAMARTTGLVWELTGSGVSAVVRAQLAGGQNPSLIYRIHAKNTPDKVALVHRDRALTFAEVDARIDRLAHGLVSRGIGRKKSLILMMKNGIEMVELGVAAARVGAAAVSISWRSTPAELAYLANHSGARGVVCDPELYPVVVAASKDLSPDLLDNVFVRAERVLGARELDELYSARPGAAFTAEGGSDDDAAVVIYTSGTTGKPKGAVRKFPRDTMPAAFRFISQTPMRCDDVHLVTCPLYHSTAFGFLTLSHVLSNTVVLMDEFKPDLFVDLVDRHRVTTTALVPTMLHRVLSLPRDVVDRHELRSLRAIFSGGAPLPGPLALDFMDRFGDVVWNFYGATETGLVTLASPRDLRHAPGTIGRAIPGNEIALLGDDGAPVADGSVGELYVKNKLLVAGYHRDDDATRSSMKDGFFSVGDLARKDAQGRYFIEGRKRDMIISGGVNVYPAEVEGVLESHPDIAEVAVVGAPDVEWGERVRAFVVARPGAVLEEGALKVWVRERLAGPKVPRDFVVLDALPRNPTGKVLKRELRAL
ncbi:MAG: AMP-binding protein [Myxococcales bacterium]|jgi:fatty-acyl-CoA synthase|nr:AMP-binding protein [Myxococcales bacterium]